MADAFWCEQNLNGNRILQNVSMVLCLHTNSSLHEEMIRKLQQISVQYCLIFHAGKHQCCFFIFYCVNAENDPHKGGKGVSARHDTRHDYVFLVTKVKTQILYFKIRCKWKLTRTSNTQVS